MLMLPRRDVASSYSDASSNSFASTNCSQTCCFASCAASEFLANLQKSAKKTKVHSHCMSKAANGAYFKKHSFSIMHHNCSVLINEGTCHGRKLYAHTRCNLLANRHASQLVPHASRGFAATHLR